jgi:hypothetical protein
MTSAIAMASTTHTLPSARSSTLSGRRSAATAASASGGISGSAYTSRIEAESASTPAATSAVVKPICIPGRCHPGRLSIAIAAAA